MIYINIQVNMYQNNAKSSENNWIFSSFTFPKLPRSEYLKAFGRRYNVGRTELTNKNNTCGFNPKRKGIIATNSVFDLDIKISFKLNPHLNV